jgi:hypothetical protein
VLQDIVSAFHEGRSLTKEKVRAETSKVSGRSGNGEDLPALFQSETGRDERAAFGRCFHHNHTERQAADDSISLGKMAGKRRRTQRKFGEKAAVGHDGGPQVGVGPRIEDIQAAAQNGQRAPAGSNRPPMGGAVNPEGEAAHHSNAAPAQIRA